jgi:hypothetical protein
MKDRVRIMLGNQEIVKRYIGDRLVWNNHPLLLELKNTSISQYWGGYVIPLRNNKVNVSDIRYVSVNDSKLIPTPESDISLYNGTSIYIAIRELRDYIGQADVRFYGE